MRFFFSFLPFRRTASPHPRSLLHPPPSLGRTDLLSRLCSPSLSSNDRKRENERDVGVYEDAEQKKMIGSWYKGKFLRGSLNGNSDFSMVLTNRFFFSIETDNDLSVSYSITLADQSVLVVSRLSLNMFRQVIKK